MVFYLGDNCTSPAFNSSYSGGVVLRTITIPSSVTDGAINISAKRRVVVDSVNYDSACSGTLLTYNLDTTPPGNLTSFDIDEDSSRIFFESMIEMSLSVKSK